MRRPTAAEFALFLLALVGLVVGWRAFWFLTDDAFIAFRYVSNSMAGFGYTWNPRPFQPVEGYTSPLWVFLLDGVWRVTGKAPPVAANGISLLFAAGTLWLTFEATRRLSRDRPSFARVSFIALVLAASVSNRTFLAWSSSGLETAMVNFWFLAWALPVGVPREPVGARIWVGRTTLATLAALTRPDGWLLVIATAALWLVSVRRNVSLLWAGLGFLPAIVHALWRRAFYGEWLPNTFHAKYVSPWPEAGLRYGLSFLLEYGLWIWGAVLLVWVVRVGRRVRWRQQTSRLVVGATALAHVAYYLFVMGGDHFEYRVLSWTVPLFYLSLLWMMTALTRSATRTAAVLLLVLVAGLPIPWVHATRSKAFTTRETTVHLQVPTADAFPPPFRSVVAFFDAQQRWLVQRSIGMRHQEHKVFWQWQIARHPLREQGEQIGPTGFPVHAAEWVGVPGWTLPNTIILDLHGLNDYVIARTPIDAEATGEGRYKAFRQMAHERTPPAGYVEAFQPNVFVPSSERHVVVEGRAPLTPERIVAIEREWRSRVGG